MARGLCEYVRPGSGACCGAAARYALRFTDSPVTVETCTPHAIDEISKYREAKRLDAYEVETETRMLAAG